MLNQTGSQASATASLRLVITGTMATHPGHVRDHNEDVVTFVLSDDAHELFAVVADGMGGHLAGEVASKLAADALARLYLTQSGAPADRLSAGMASANHAIYERSHTDPACVGMGTTCTALAIWNGAAYLAHIGDSRAYLWRDGTLHQMSEDHSLVAQMVRDGTLTEDEAKRHPTRSILLKALGTQPDCSPMIWYDGLPTEAGDRWLLCSDGLSDALDASVIAAMVGGLPPAEACQALINQALAGAAPDNISAGVFGVDAIG